MIVDKYRFLLSRGKRKREALLVEGTEIPLSTVHLMLLDLSPSGVQHSTHYSLPIKLSSSLPQF